MVLGRAHSLVVVQKQAAIFILHSVARPNLSAAAEIETQSQPNRGYGKRLPCHLFRRWQRGHACAPVNA